MPHRLTLFKRKQTGRFLIKKRNCTTTIIELMRIMKSMDYGVQIAYCAQCIPRLTIHERNLIRSWALSQSAYPELITYNCKSLRVLIISTIKNTSSNIDQHAPQTRRLPPITDNGFTIRSLPHPSIIINLSLE